MTKQEQMEYLQVACDAEDAVFACEKAIEALEAKINTICPPEYPPEPKPVKYKDYPTSADLLDFSHSLPANGVRIPEYNNQYHIIAKIISVLIGVVSCILLLALIPPSSNIPFFLAWCYLPPVLAFAAWKIGDYEDELYTSILIGIVSYALLFVLGVPFVTGLDFLVWALPVAIIAIAYNSYIGFASIVFGAYLYALPLIANPSFLKDLPSLAIFILPVVITLIAWKVSGRSADHKKRCDYDNQVLSLYADKRQADKDRYHQEDQRFRKQLKVYDQGCQLTRDAKGKIAQELERLRAQVRTLDAQRQQVYALGILHERFHNSLAVHQLREYFDMGVCDSLEGSGGAIAQFLMDIRTNRICGSIDELRTAVETGMQTIISNQGHILREVRETNDRITSMGNAISSQLNFMHSNILSAQHAAQAKMEACMQEATKHLDNIGTTLKDAAHNEYIAMKAAKVEGYLNLRHIG